MDKKNIKEHLTSTFLSEDKKPVGLTSTEKIQADSKKFNADNQKEVAKEMEGYEKSLEKETEPVKYENSDSDKEYHEEMETMNGLEMNRFQNEPNEAFKERAEKAIAGDASMGNSPDYANVVTADQAGFTGPDFGKNLVKKIKSSKEKRDKSSELSNKNKTSVSGTDFKDSAMNNKSPKSVAISENKESSNFKDKIYYAGKELTLDTIYNEDKQKSWDDDAQAMIDYHKKNGKKAAVIHKGNEHGLYVEKSIKENKSNKMKRLVFKKEFKGVGNALNVIPESYKVDGKEFHMTDGNEKYEIRWEGSLTEGKAIVLKASDKNLMNEDMENMKRLMGYKSQDTLGTVKGSNRIDENKKFNDIWGKTKNLMTEMTGGYGFTGEGNLEGMDEEFPDLTGDGKVTQADILKGRGVELDEDEGKSYQHNGYTYYIDSETGEVTGGPEDKDNKYGFSIKDEGENTWRYEGYGEEVYKSVINNRPLTPSNDPSIENHPYVKTVLNHFFSELPNEELETSKTNLGLEVTDENGIVSISIEIDNGGGVKKYTCDNGKCRFNKD